MKYKHLNLKYAFINCFYYMLMCGAMGFANNYLQYKEFGTSLIGIILTVVSIGALIGQTGMAPVVDHSEKLNEKRFILITLVVTSISFLLIAFLPDGSPLIILFWILGGAFGSMGLPYLNSIAFIYEKEGQKINYGLGRGIGSASYAVAGFIIGQLISRMNAGILPYWLFIMGVLTFISVLSLPVPERIRGEEKDIEKEKTGKKTGYGAFFRKYHDILLVCISLICLFFCHMLINSFMLDVIRNIGGNAADQGNATFIQAMVEMPPLFAFAWLLKKCGVDKLMLIGAVFYSIKHILVLIAPNMTVYYIAMVLQMFSYAIIVPGMVYFADEHIAAEDRNQGQAIMTAMTTIGNLLASFCGGMMISALGVHTALLIGTVISVIGTILMAVGIMKSAKDKREL